MAGKLSIHGEVEINNCSPHKFVEMFRGKQEHIPNICPHINGIEAHHDDWTTVGETTRRWDYVHQGESRYLTERIVSVDEEKNMIVLAMIDGDIMKMFYKTFVSIIEVIPKGEGGCLVKWTIEYEKLHEDAPEPRAELEFVLALAKDLGDHHLTNP